jgi:hypothetical protein
MPPSRGMPLPSGISNSITATSSVGCGPVCLVPAHRSHKRLHRLPAPLKSSRSIYRSSLERLAAAAEESIAHRPFKYVNKGSMATVSRFSAVAQVGKFEFGGFIAWLAWLVLHLLYLVGFKNRFTTVIAWFITFITHSRGQLAITSQMIYA